MHSQPPNLGDVNVSNTGKPTTFVGGNRKEPSHAYCVNDAATQFPLFDTATTKQNCGDAELVRKALMVSDESHIAVPWLLLI